MTLSGDEGEDDVDAQDEQWRVERLEREKWMQGTCSPAQAVLLIFKGIVQYIERRNPNVFGFQTEHNGLVVKQF